MIDQSAIMNLVELGENKRDLTLIKDLQEIFSTQTPKLLQMLFDGIKNNIHSDVFHVAHTLKSSSSYLGMEEVVSLCEKLEAWSKKKEKSDLEAYDLARALQSSYETSIHELGLLIARLSLG